MRGKNSFLPGYIALHVLDERLTLRYNLGHWTALIAFGKRELHLNEVPDSSGSRVEPRFIESSLQYIMVLQGFFLPLLPDKE